MNIPVFYRDSVKEAKASVEAAYEKASKRKNSKAQKPAFITRLQGDAESDTLIVAPVPGHSEYEANLAWCSNSTRQFFSFLETTKVPYAHSDYLIVPCLFSGTKPAKGNHEVVSATVLKAVESKQIKRFIVVGGVPFRLHFGKGKSVDPSVAGGVILYPELLKGKPLYMFPDMKAFSMSDSDLETLNYFGRKQIERSRWLLTQVMLTECLPNFANFMKTRKV
jgi:hypothetical protein